MKMPVIEDKYIKIGDINTRFWSAGETGTPVVFVHGLGGSIENWVYNIEPLAARHRVFALDLKGFGRTDKTPLVKDLEELMQFLGDFMDAQHIDKASLVGNSLGGGLVLYFTIKNPARVNRLILVDNAGIASGVILDLKLVSIPVLGNLLARVSRKSVADLWRKIVFNPALVTDELVEKTYQLAVLPDARKALLATTRAGISIGGQRARYRRLVAAGFAGMTAPTLICWGRQDRIIPVAHGVTAAEKIPHASLRVFNNCGHMPQFEYPEDFNTLLLNFLAGK
jgi:pimeloyl-ACP methyl ester carboxylesterase